MCGVRQMFHVIKNGWGMNVGGTSVSAQGCDEIQNKEQSLLHSEVNATISKLITVTVQLPRLKNCLWLCDAKS